MQYSVCFLDKHGLTRRSETDPFDDDAAAIANARTQSPNDAIVEVWKDEELIVRVFRDSPPAPAATP